MTFKSFQAVLRAGALSLGCVISVSACSGGAGSSFPLQSTPSSATNATSTGPTSNGALSATGAESVPATGTGVSIASPPGSMSISRSSLRLDAANVTPLASTGTSAYADTFESDAIGSQPAGWSLARGSWSVCQQASSHEACASAGGIEALVGDASWTNYHVDTTVVDSNLNQGGVSVLGRVQDATHFYQLELRRDESSGSANMAWYIFKYDGRGWSEIAGGAANVQSNTHYRLRLAFTGAVISAFISYNGSDTFAALGSGTDASFVSGKIGLRSWGSGTTRFDNVNVTLDGAASPSPSPVPTSTAVAVGNVATYAGCPIFTPGDYYNADVSSAAVDAHSPSYISSISATDNTGFYASTGIERVNIANSITSLYSIHPKVPYHSFNYLQPWQNGYYIEGGGNSPSGDAHSMVLLATPPACHLYELYNTSLIGNVLSAYSGATWDLSKPFMSRNVRGSAMASGLSIFAGMVKHEEITSGIHHALNFSMFSGSPCRCYTAPATATDGLAYQGPSTAYEFPYGGHLRLKASFDDSRFGPQAKAIAEAMKRYGMYLADVSGHYGNNNAVYLANPTDGGSWNTSDLGSLGNLKFSDFDVLTVGTVTPS